MMTTRFVPAHLAALKLGAEERVEYARFGPGLFGALTEFQGPACSLVSNSGRIVGCFGMLVAGHTGVLWAVLSDEARANRFGLHRATRRQLERIERLIPTDHIITAVRKGFEPGRRWVTRLGFTHDGDFHVGGERYERYVK